LTRVHEEVGGGMNDQEQAGDVDSALQCGFVQVDLRSGSEQQNSDPQNEPRQLTDGKILVINSSDSVTGDGSALQTVQDLAMIICRSLTGRSR